MVQSKLTDMTVRFCSFGSTGYSDNNNVVKFVIFLLYCTCHTHCNCYYYSLVVGESLVTRLIVGRTGLVLVLVVVEGNGIEVVAVLYTGSCSL